MLIQCQECGRKISDQAKFCPHCGAGVSIARGFSETKRMAGIIVGVIIGITGLVIFIHTLDPTPISTFAGIQYQKELSDKINQLQIFAVLIFCVGIAMTVYFNRSNIKK